MISLPIIIMVIWAHFVGDFILQSDAHATGKSKDNMVLLSHIMMYSLPFVILSVIIDVSVLWVALNAALHFVTDYFTSRKTSKLWAEGERHWFFVVIGADQAIHLTCLLISLLFFV